MRLCRYDDDRMGVVRGELVHDVTEAQTKIRAAAPYAMKGDAVIAALPAWRSRLEEMAAKAPGKPISAVKLLSPVARPSKLVAAPTNYKAHIEEMADGGSLVGSTGNFRHQGCNQFVGVNLALIDQDTCQKTEQGLRYRHEDMRGLRPHPVSIALDDDPAVTEHDQGIGSRL